jgi:hypothetical protein
LFQSMGISSGDKLANDTTYTANGSGPDSVLDILKLNYANSATGDVLISGKFASSGRLITTSTTNVVALPISGALTGGVLSGISSVNACMVSASAANNATSLASCLDSGFKERGASTASAYLTMLNNYVGTLANFRPAVLKWCDFDDSTVTMESTASTLAGKTGVCLAKVPFTNNQGGTTLYDAYYKFTVNGAGTGISTVKMLGNGMDGSFNVYPAIEKKIQIDGLSENAGVINSGYRFEINNSLSGGQRYPLSAKVELIKFDNSVIATVYLRCQQVSPTNPNATCQNTNLSICTDASCATTDNTSGAISNANSAVATQIMTALQTGPVRATMTAYTNVDRTGSSFTKPVPINELPIPQSEVAEAVMPTLNAKAISDLQKWDGSSSSLSLGFSSGVAGVRVGGFYSDDMQINVQAQPDRGSSILNLSGVGMSNASSLMTGADVCAVANLGKTYRAITLVGSYRDTPVFTKYFGSCTAGSY